MLKTTFYIIPNSKKPSKWVRVGRVVLIAVGLVGLLANIYRVF